MLYEKLKDLSAAQLKRYCGVKKKTFDKMCQIVAEKTQSRRLVAGRPPKVSVSDQVLLTLEYWREYRTQFHIAKSWGLSESTVCRITQRVEDILKDCPEFRLPGKKVLKENDLALEVVVVDVGETPIERPKKNKSDTTPARKSGILSSRKSSLM